MSLITPEIRDRWVAALRSGRYEQGRNSLLSYDSPVYGDGDLSGGATWCCLGVLCDVMGIPAPNLFQMEWPEFADNTPAASFLANLNDNGASFDQIADIIEASGDPAAWDFVGPSYTGFTADDYIRCYS